MTNYVLWAFFLILGQAAQTMVSRARNSRSYHYHWTASIFSHGIWFVSQLFLLDSVMGVIRGGDWSVAVPIGLFYTVFASSGSVAMHKACLDYIEKGTRKVGG